MDNLEKRLKEAQKDLEERVSKQITKALNNPLNAIAMTDYAGFTYVDEYSIEKHAKECQDDVTKCTHFELCVFATHGIYRQINQYRPRHVDQVKKLNIDCSLGIHMNKFYAKFSNFEGICKVKGGLSELLDPLLQDIIKKIPKNKI